LNKLENNLSAKSHASSISSSSAYSQSKSYGEVSPENLKIKRRLEKMVLEISKQIESASKNQIYSQKYEKRHE
jgi:hypothetical protein